MNSPFSLTPQERQVLGRLARQSIQSALQASPAMKNPVLPPELADSLLSQPLGSFVTLKKDGQLRGCIGTMIGREPLFANVWRMARAAAFDDWRFPPLDLAEWPAVQLHISVLGPLTPCPGLSHVILGRHGLLLEASGRNAVFLPEVPVEQVWDRQTYVEQLCRKAGLPPESWKLPQARLFWYETVHFDAVPDA